MKLISVKCPECGATLEVNNDRTFAYCTYCGNKVIISDERIRIDHHIYDEAKLREIDIREKEKQALHSAYNYEENLWKEWKSFVYKWAAVSWILILFVGILTERFNLDIEGNIILETLLKLFVVSYMAGPVFVLMKRPKATKYIPDSILCKHGYIASYFILIGLFLSVGLLLGMIFRIFIS